MLNRCLARCQPITGELRCELNRLAPGSSPIRLLNSTTSDRSGSATGITEPFACGMVRRTIVLPNRIEQTLSPEELKALLAHEVAHLVRRDPWWMLVFEFLCSSLAFQPLSFLARRRWQQAAELLCDDWAIGRHHSAISLASCLMKIAEWRLNRKSTAMGLAAMGRSGALTQRIEWLLRPGRTSEHHRSHRRTLATLLTFMVGLLVGVYGPRLSFDVPADAADDAEAVRLTEEIDRELDEALRDLALID